MINKKILIVAPYPIVNPMHGGQKRVGAIFDFYQKIFREVKFVGIYHRGHYADKGPDDLWLGDSRIISKVDSNPYAGEIIQGEAISDDINVRSYFAEILKNFNPDIVQIEQGYPFAGVRILLNELNLKPKIVFSSHNIEYKMKRDIFEYTGLPKDTYRPLVDKIKKLEIDLSQAADLVIAVSESDRKELLELGAKRVIVAPNGISKVESSIEAKAHWQDYREKYNLSNIALFVGSAHPPNWEGFLEMLGEDTQFIPNNARLIMAGGASEYFLNNYPKKLRQAFWSHCESVGRLSDDELAGLIGASDVIILPITSGGGSNLKTAEAILSEKKIVSTTRAFRGFEKYTMLPNIFIADTRDKFRAELLRALSADYILPSKQHHKLAQQVQWRYVLVPLEGELRRLARSQDRERILAKLAYHYNGFKARVYVYIKPLIKKLKKLF